MPDIQRPSSPKFYTRQTSSNESLSEQKTVIRKFINSAIYVEKSVPSPLRKKSCLVHHGDTRNAMSDRSVKRCVCGSSESCPCHPAVPELECRSTSVLESHSDSSSFSNESQITVKSKPSLYTQGTDLKLRLESVCSTTANFDGTDKEETVRLWLKRKDEERKLKERKEAEMRKMQEKERERTLERERENFRRWLMIKKQEEEKLKRQKLKEEEERKKREEEKERQREENEERFNMWLNRKKRAELEKKIKEKIALLQIYEEKQKRMEQSEKAFKEWLMQSKNKPKPIPLNRGIQSLCSSTSVTYINPVPWTPNIENIQKPVSQ